MYLFRLPFKAEEFHHTEQQKQKNPSARRSIYDIVKKRLKNPIPIDEEGKAMSPVQWIKPDINYVNGELYK